MVTPITNVSYCPSNPEDALRQFDFYIPKESTEKSSVICFIHGGAWKSEDKRDHEQTARNLVKATGCPVAVPNYRLTPTNNKNPEYHHPMHVRDMLQFLSFLREWKSESGAFNPNSLILLGHSCSAHMLSSAFLSNPDSSICPSDELLNAVKAIILSEGIFDIDALLVRFPGYREWFIEAAFGTSDSYAQFSTLKYSLRTTTSSPISWLVLHSKGDTLVDQGQSDAMYAHLLDIVGHDLVAISTEDLKDEHNAILVTDTYANLVKNFISKYHLQ